MSWIKKRYDQFLLVLAALALIGVSALLAMNVKSFPEKFSEAQAPVVPGAKIQELDLKELQAAEEAVKKPLAWQVPKEGNQFVFVPRRYILDKATGLPKPPDISALHKDSLTGTDIPSPFFLENNLPLLDATVATQDPDKDGFLNEDEWRGSRDPEQITAWKHDSTDPNKADSHPPFITKLSLKQWIRIPFRLLFQSYDGDPKAPEKMTFQINAKDRGSKTEFLKLGDKVAGSRYKLLKFVQKEEVNPSTGGKKDVSELTILDTESNAEVILVKETLTDSPDSQGVLDYAITGKPITVPKGGDFVLLPETDKRYKLVDISEGRAVIQLPDGKGTYVVVPDPRKK